MRNLPLPYTEKGITIFLRRGDGYLNFVEVYLNEGGKPVGCINYENGNGAVVSLGKMVEDPRVATTLSRFVSELYQSCLRKNHEAKQ